MLRFCPRCKTELPDSAFSATSKWCRPCRRDYQRDWRSRDPEHSRALSYQTRLRRDLGMDLAEYERMWNAQLGCCAICGVRSGESPASKPRLQVDHDHSTGVVRGLLCSGCNRGIAGFRDDPTLIETAITYIAHHSTEPQVQ